MVSFAALRVRVLNGLANFDKEVEPLARRQVVLVAVVGDLDAAHQFHDESFGLVFSNPASNPRNGT